MTYTLVKNHMNDVQKRHGYNQLATDTYGLSFEKWYNSGHFDGSHVPYTVFDGDKAISNISINFMDVEYEGRLRKYVQIGTVMTDKLYRGQGLQRLIFNQIMADLQGKCDAIFLFANARVLDFYPKFGFEKASEYTFTKTVTGTCGEIHQLDMCDAQTVDMVKKYYMTGNPFSAMKVQNGFALEMFYLSGPYSSCVYYLPQHDAVVVAEKDGDKLTVLDIFCEKGKDLDSILSTFCQGETEVTLGFTPVNKDGWRVTLFDDDDTTLFVHKDGENIFSGKQLLFPLIAHT